MHRILVLRGGALGDFIVTLPTLAALRARWPEAQIELAGNTTAAELALHRGLLNAAHSQHEARWAALFSSTPLPADFRGWLGEFDLVLNYWPNADGELARHFPVRAGQTFLSADTHPTRAPAAVHYAEPLRSLGINLSTDQLWLPLGSKVGRVIPHPPALLSAHETATSDRRVKDHAPYPRIAIHPGSGSSSKNWPLPNWRSLCRRLRETMRAELLIVTGEAEPLSVRASLAEFGQFADQLPLEEVVTALCSCDTFIGHDSGVSHLAAACGLPSVLLFGPTDPAIWAPPAPHVHVLRKGASVEEISADDVQAAVSRLFGRG